jgi:dTDP-3-amino-2,3,6-trideoxy-4-keto-D-glucose/dTDP-3-amino-3,4,6-trideoxy-alpha-D-glucose/dTDP-2,6-dideoxy-D-kanosamine transaminase
MDVRYSYLSEQFSDCEDLWSDLKKFVATGDFTLGEPLRVFEERFAELIGADYAVGVNSGTDAIKLALKAAGIRPGDEVITAANTFVATVGAIVELGAIPVFIDCDDTFCMNTNKIAQVITKKTRAIVPVHFTGYMTDMRQVSILAEEHSLAVVEDACQSILGAIDGKHAGTWGLAGAFSLHPLKNLNVWSDGGVIVTDDRSFAKELRLLRNHGLHDRDTVVRMGFNSRLDTLQAVVGNWLLPKTKEIADQRIQNAKFLDEEFGQIRGVRVPIRPSDFHIVYHLYMIFAEKRDELLEYCLTHGIEAKVHYPVPIYRQPALKHLGYEEGDFPVSDRHAKSVISFPCDQHLSKEQLESIVSIVRKFYGYMA